MKHVLEEGEVSKLEGGDSGETFLVKHGDKKFVLRNYENKKDADYNALIHRRLMKYGFLPQLYHQEKSKILYEYIKGRDCKKSDALKVAEQVGKICARINQLKIKGGTYKEKSVTSHLQLLKDKKIIDDSEFVFLERRYSDLKKKVKPKIAVDFDDVYAENFRIKNERVYLVDIECFEKKIKGRGIGKAFLRWFKTPLQRKKFKQGYKSVTSALFLTEEYLQLLYLDFTIYIVAYKVRKNIALNRKDLRRLLKLAHGENVNL